MKDKMNCPDCGTLIPEGRIFCPSCGKELLGNVMGDQATIDDFEGYHPYMQWKYPYTLFGEATMTKAQYFLVLTIEVILLGSVAILALLAGQLIFSLMIFAFSLIFEVVWWRGGRKAAKGRSSVRDEDPKEI